MRAVQLTAALLLIALLGSLSLAAEQVEDDGWRKVCSSLAPKNGAPRVQSAIGTACYTYTSVIDKPTQIRIASIGILSCLEADEAWLLVLLPLGSVLPPLGMIEIDLERRIQLHYLEPPCNIHGCIGIAKLDAASLDLVRAAKQLAYVSPGVSGKELRSPLRAGGFTKLLDGEPMPEGSMSYGKNSFSASYTPKGPH